MIKDSFNVSCTLTISSNCLKQLWLCLSVCLTLFCFVFEVSCAHYITSCLEYYHSYAINSRRQFPSIQIETWLTLIGQHTIYIHQVSDANSQFLRACDNMDSFWKIEKRAKSKENPPIKSHCAQHNLKGETEFFSSSRWN